MSVSNIEELTGPNPSTPAPRHGGLGYLPIPLPAASVATDAVFAAGRIWVTAYGDGQARLYSINPELHRLEVQPLPLVGTQLSLASSGNYLWVADLDRPVVTRIALEVAAGARR